MDTATSSSLAPHIEQEIPLCVTSLDENVTVDFHVDNLEVDNKVRCVDVNGNQPETAGAGNESEIALLKHNSIIETENTHKVVTDCTHPEVTSSSQTPIHVSVTVPLPQPLTTTADDQSHSTSDLRNDANSTIKQICSFRAMIWTIVFIFAVVTFAIGGIYRHECPINSSIPTYLFVLGLFVLLVVFIQCIFIREDCLEKEINPRLRLLVNSFILFSFLLWFVVGQVWVFTAFPPVFHDAASEKYCNYNVYSYAFGFTIFLYCVIGGSCCYLVKVRRTGTRVYFPTSITYNRSR